MSTEDIRDRIRKARREIPKPYRAGASAKIGETFLKHPAFVQGANVAGFLAFDGEADPLGLMIAAHELGKQIFVPVIVGRNQPLSFAPWSPGCAMKKNRFGISEPDVDSSLWMAPNQLDFVITPLVAFDQNLNRIGVGGGFYDRTFEFLQTDSDESPPTLVGFAFEMQKVKKIQTHEWDIRLDGVITELKTYSG